jgi:AraC-like DNA-binding protein
MSRDASVVSPSILRPACLPGIELVRYPLVGPRSRYVSPSYMAVLLQNATGRFRYRARDLVCRPGAVNLLDPEEVCLASHEARGAPAIITHLLIAPEVILRTHAEAGRAGPVHLAPAPENGVELAAALLRLERQIHARLPALGLQETLALLLERLSPNMRSSAERGGLRERRAVTRIRATLHARIEDELSLDDLAAEAGLTKPYLVRVFAREVGLPPHEYLMHLRVARATRLLARGVPAGDVAHDVGFYDQSHLNRWFKKVIGVTPGQYARAAT